VEYSGFFCAILLKKWAHFLFNEANLATYRDAFLDDLKTMEEQGVQGFDFAQVRAWLAEK